MLTVNKHCATIALLLRTPFILKVDRWEGPEGVRLIEVSL